MKTKGAKNYTPNETDEKKVRLMAACGMTVSQIAAVIGVSRRTIYAHYKKLIQTAALEATAQVAGNLFQMTKKNPAAAIFWMKTRAGWREKDNDAETSDKPPTVIVNVTPKPNG